MQFWNENLKKLAPYIPGEQNKNLIKLNTNENPFPPSPNIFKIIKEISPQNLTLYPDPLIEKLKKNIANNYNTKVKNIFCGNGSDEILNLIIRAFVNINDKIIIPYPNYFLYEVLAGSYGVEYEYSYTDKDFNINFEKLLSIPSKLIFISNPNSPTGKLTTLNDIHRFAKLYKGLVVVDEAYIDFSGDENNSAIKLIEKLNNIIVIRTLSKSFSLAGIRLGYAFANENIIEGLNRIKDSYNINILSQVIANQAFIDYSYMKEITVKVIENRKLLHNELKNMNFSIVDSKANFLFCSHKLYKAENIFRKLKENGLLVRHFKKPLINNYIRITIGTKKQIETLIECLKKIII